MEEIPIYYLICPNKHLIETWVRDTKICNRCHQLKDIERARKRNFPLHRKEMMLRAGIGKKGAGGENN